MTEKTTKPTIIIVGFPKSGTSTLQKAFAKSGIRSAHWKHDGKVVGKMIYDGWFDEGDPFFHFDDVDAITQMDFCNSPNPGDPLQSYWPNLDISLLIAIRKMYPNCKFILNFRSPNATTNSMSRWYNLQQRIIQSDCTGLPKGRGSLEEIERWITTHIDAIRHVFQEDENFLDLDIASSDARTTLETFLGRKLSWWGVANKNDKANKSRSPT